MKIIISYPPFSGVKGIPLLSQNRQYQVFSEKSVIYPVVPAYAATLIKNAGHQVIWLDCIAGGISYDKFLKIIQQEKPDLIALETKTPVVKQHWKIINEIKGLSPKTVTGHFPSELNRSSSMESVPPIEGTVPKIVLFGDHVTALPEESFQNSQVDFVVTGGDYDFLLLNLCNNIKKGQSPAGTVPFSVGLEPGIYYRENGQIKNTGKFQLDHDLNSLPFIDRDLTKWWLYAYKNGNYKRTPGTYIMSGRDCWFSLCSFCSWRTLYTNYRVRKPKSVADEIGFLIENYNIKTIFDDTGTFPIGEWLKEFCQLLIDRRYNNKIDFSCNARFGSLSLDDYKLMKKAGFRMLLFGLESANQKTLDKINKHLTIAEILNSCKEAKKASLEPHLTIMFGYPWETKAEVEKTFQLGKFLLKKGYADTLQATIVIPYPGTNLFDEAMKKGWLKTLDWQRYDMGEPIMKIPVEDEEIMKLVRSTYKIAFSPEFVIRRIINVRSLDDIKFVFRAAKRVLGHIRDFEIKRNKCD